MLVTLLMTLHTEHEDMIRCFVTVTLSLIWIIIWLYNKDKKR
jgi:hypothetical protein